MNLREYSITNVKRTYGAEIERKDCESEYLSFCHLDSGGVFGVCESELRILTRL